MVAPEAPKPQNSRIMSHTIVFGTDGWRGQIARDFTFDNALTVANAIGAWNAAPENPDPGDPWTFVVGNDTRFLAPEVAHACSLELSRKGFRVLLADRPIPTPCVSWHVKSRRLRGGLVITASHNPFSWNGIKYKAHFGGSALPSAYKAISKLLGSGLPDQAGGTLESVDLETTYREAIVSLVDIETIRKAGLSVLFDAMHGSSGDILERIVGTGGSTRVTTVRKSRDPLFGGVNPEPIPQHLGESVSELARGSYDVLLASDGDGDRLGVVAPDGSFVTPHRILALLAEDLITRGRIHNGIGKTFSTSLLVDRVGTALHTPVYCTPIGFKHLASLMIEGQIGIGGEESGGLGVSFYLPERDGIFSALLVLEAIARSGKSLTALLSDQDRRYGSFSYGRRDVHGPMPVLRKFVASMLEAPPETIAGERVTGLSNMDGVKLSFGERGWVLHRLSGTEPIIRIYVEHEDPARVSAILAQQVERLEKNQSR